MFSVGRVVVKIAGRDARKIGVIVKVLDNNHVLIDGQVRRRKCNLKHLEPLDKEVKIKENAPSEEVYNALKKIGVEINKGNPRTTKERPKKQHSVKSQNKDKKQKKSQKTGKADKKPDKK